MFQQNQKNSDQWTRSAIHYLSYWNDQATQNKQRKTNTRNQENRKLNRPKGLMGLQESFAKLLGMSMELSNDP